MKDFFVSYNKADRAWAEWIAWQLKEQGKQVVIQAWHFGPGCNFVVEMDKALQECEKILLVLSPDFLLSNFTKAEWTTCFAKDPTGEKGLIAPVRVRDCEPEGLLGPRVYLDLVGITPEAEAQRLLMKGLFSGGPPTTPPGFPPDMAPGGGPGPGPKPPFPGPSSGAANAIAFNVPHQRNPNFSGREDYLTALGAALAGGPAALTQQAIAGLGGVGKTQLALEYCHRQRGAYPLVWWVRCEEPATLASDFAGLAAPLGLPQSQDQKETVAAVRQRLATLPGWLLVLDNVNQPEDITPYLPQGGQGHVLITSRHQAWRGLAAPLKVEVWPQDEAVDFLLKRTGGADRADAEQLARELGCLPLALEQAGAFVEETGCTLAEYLGLLASHQQDLLAKGSSLSGYERTVATTWLPAFEAVQRKSPAATELLNLCAFFAPDDIPLEVIKEGKEFLPQALAGAVDEPLQWNEALAALKAYSLVQREGDSLSIHRLVQAVTRDRLGEEERKEWTGVAVRVVRAAVQGDVWSAVEKWPLLARLVAHGHMVVCYAEATGVELGEGSRILDRVATYLQARGEYHNAKNLFERALDFTRSTFGEDHPNVSPRRNNLGLVLQDLGDLKAAREQMELALDSDLKTHGPDHPEVAKSRNNLAGVLRDLGELKAAREQLELALASNLKTYGLNHSEVALRRNTLGVLLRDLGDLPAAREHFELALAIVEKVLGADHPNVATLRNNLGSVLRDLGELPAAREQVEMALASGMKTFGPDHPDVATRRNNLGNVLQDLGDLPAAREHFELALAIRERFLPSEHPHIILSLRNLAVCHEALGNHGQADELRARAESLQAQRQAKGLDG